MSQTPQNTPAHSLVPIASIAEAVNWASGVGISHIDYDGDLRIARIVTAALKDIQRTNLPLPSVILVNHEAFVREFRDEAIDVPAGTIGSILLLNPAPPYWDFPDRVAARAHKRLIWSTGNALHPIYHEAGHFSHYKSGNDPVIRWKRRHFKAGDERIANRVSRYARENFAECIAEIVAALLAGESVESDIVEWYRKRGGIVP